MSAPLQTSKIEQQWQELCQHLNWSEGFSLIFYFSDNIPAMAQLQQRVKDYYHGRTTQLTTICYQPTPDWLQHTLSSILQQDHQTPLWLTLNQDASAAAEQNYTQLLFRLNERRDPLRRDHKQALFIVLPEHFLATCRETAPDLWVVRALSEVIEQNREPPPKKIGQHTDRPSQETINARQTEHQQQLIQEWQRLRQKKSTDKGTLLATERAFQELIKLQRSKEAQLAADDMLKITRQGDETPQALRDLSISLDNAGQVAQQQGRWHDAQAAHDESLQLCRGLASLLGEAPQALRDLSVSLDHVGQVAQQQGRWHEAQAAYDESLQLRRGLASLLGEAPEALRDLSVSLNHVGQVAQQQGRWHDAQAAYEEGLQLRRGLASLLGEAPQALRDLSISLDHVGQVAEQQGRWHDAQAAYEESLQLHRRLASLLGEAPQALRDLSVSLNHVGQVAQQQGRWHEAQAAYDESLQLCRHLASLLGETPQALRELSISLDNVGLVAEQQGRWHEAQAAYEESLQLRRGLASLLGEAPQALRDLSISLKHVGQVAQQQGRWHDAQAAYEESLQLSRRLASLLGEAPEALRDLLVSLYQSGVLHSDPEPTTAQNYFNEGLQIAQRLNRLFPLIPQYATLPERFKTALTELKHKRNSP